MKRDSFGFNNTVFYILRDKDGNIKEKGCHKNQVQNLTLVEVIDAVDAGTHGEPIIEMAIGTGTGQAVSDTALSSLSSYEATVNVQSGSPEDTVTCTSTFTAGGSWTITEAGLFGTTGCASEMLFYDGSLNVGMTADDTLQIDWEISVS